MKWQASIVSQIGIYVLFAVDIAGYVIGFAESNYGLVMLFLGMFIILCLPYASIANYLDEQNGIYYDEDDENVE